MIIALERWQRRARRRGDVRRTARRRLPGAALGLRAERQRHDALHRRQIETLTAGQAYYIRPGHNAHVDEDVDLVEFTHADETPGINTLAS